MQSVIELGLRNSWIHVIALGGNKCQ